MALRVPLIIPGRMQLHFTKELTDPYLAEIGTPYRVFRDAPGRFLAVCSKLPCPSVPDVIPSIRPSFHHRVSLYLDGSMALLATVECWFPIQDIAFHPTETLLAIGTGSYDGGWNYLGQLLLWNWERNQCESLLAESREVVRVRFDDNGALTFLLRPRDDEEFWENLRLQPESTFVGTTLDDLTPRYSPQYNDGWTPDPRLADLRPINPTALGFDTPEPFNHLQLPADEQSLYHAGFKQRGAINDALWLTDDTIAVTHTNCLVEFWSLSDGLQSSLPSSLPGLTHGHHLFPISEGSTGCWVHEVEDHWGVKEKPPGTPLSRVHHLENSRILSTRAFGSVGTMMQDSRGSFLLMTYREYQLWLSDASHPVLLSSAIFDTPGYLSPVAGTNQIHFLKVEMSKRPGSVTLSRLGPDNVMESLWTQQEPSTDLRALSPTSLAINEELIIFCRTRLERGRTVETFLECRRFADGNLLWSHASSSFEDVHAMCYLHDCQAVAFASGDGKIGLINVLDGQLLNVLAANAGGVPAIITALAASGNRLLAGTLEGRLLLYTVQDQVTPNAAA